MNEYINPIQTILRNDIIIIRSGL